MIEMDETTSESKLSPWFIWPPIAIVLLLIMGILIGRNIDRNPSRGLFPYLSSPTPIALIFDGQPALVSFEELQDDPFAYVNRPIQVTGDLLFLEPLDCLQHSGPNMGWALIADDLRLDAVGFERVVTLVPPNTTLTIQGIWRNYSGPAGCGKGPAIQNFWYLAVSRIVQPNPLLDVNGQPIVILGDPPAGADGIPEVTRTATGTAVPEILITSIPSSTATPTVSAPPPNTTPTSVILATQTPESPTGDTPTVEVATPIPTETNDPTVTPNGESTETAVPTATGELPPPAATSTPGGYPGTDPTQTPAPTATLSSYP